MQALSADESFRQTLDRMNAALQGFVSGDTTLWKELCSRRDDVTIAGGWGDYERGWVEVGPRYDWAAARFAGGEVACDIIATEVSGDLAYTFHIERATVRLAGADEPAPMALRVTHIYRREAGDWKLVHRHADPIMGKRAAETVLQR